MRLIDFQVKNYRSCIKTNLHPNVDLTALIGINSSGKSSILNAVLLLKKLSNPRMRPEMVKRPYVSHSTIYARIEIRGKIISCKGNVFYETSDRNVDDVVGSQLKWNLESITGKADWIDLPMGMFLYGHQIPFFLSENANLSFNDMNLRNIYAHKYYSRRFRKIMLSEKAYLIILEIFKYFSGINYYSASQFSDPTRCPVSIELEDQQLTDRKQSDIIDHTQFIHDLFQAKKAGSPTYKRFLNIVGADGIGLIRDISFDEFTLPSSIVEIKAGGKAITRKKTRNLIVPIFKTVKARLSPNQLSEGTFKTLALLFYVLTDKSHLLLIEEPEVCIHHGLLNSIISLIKKESREKQIIITTHSDYVLDQLAPEKVVIVDKTKKDGTTARAITKALSRSDFKALKKYLEDSGNLGEYWREGGLKND